MSIFPSLPYVQANLSQRDHVYALNANARWQDFAVPLRPKEKAKVTLLGEIVYHYREWTTSGSCGKKKHHVKRKKCRAHEDIGSGVFGLSNGDGGEPFFCFGKEKGQRCQPSKELVIGETELTGRREGRLTGIVYDCLNGNGGDNQGAYRLEVSVDWNERAQQLFQVLENFKAVLSSEDATLPKPIKVARDILRWETPRISLDSEQQTRFCKLLTDLGQEILKNKKATTEEPAAAGSPPKTGNLTDLGSAWVKLAGWLGEWSVTESAGGRASHGHGWILRGDAAAKEGDLTLAQKWFTTGLNQAEPGPILYKLGKLQEMKGIFFSPKNDEIQSLESAKISLGKPEKALLIGACDLYELSLSENKIGNISTVGEGAAAKTEEKKEPLLRQLTSYDTHYALGRLKYLRHTTRSLEESVSHFRQCRKLARYRSLTNEALYSEYTFRTLLDDVREAHPNPFYTGGRVATDDMPAIVALKNVKAILSGEAPASFGGDESRNHVDIKNHPDFEFSWLALAGQSGVDLVQDSEAEADVSKMSEGIHEIDAAQEVVRNWRDLEGASIHGTDKDNVFLRAGFEPIGNRIVDSFRRIGEASVEREDEFSVVRWLQQPMYWVGFVLSNALGKFAEKSFGQDFDWAALHLLKLKEAEEAGKKKIQFTFSEGVSAHCELEGERLILRLITVKLSDTDTQYVRLEYESVRIRSESTNSSKEFILREISLFRNEKTSKKELLFKVKLEAAAADSGVGFSRLISQVTIQDHRLRTLIDNGKYSEFAQVITNTESYNYAWTWVLNFKNLEDAVESSRPSLASAYRPGMTSAQPEVFPKVSAEDLRWLLAWPKLPVKVANGVTRELGRRLLERLAPDDDHVTKDKEAIEAASVLFDVVTEQFSQSEGVNRSVKAIASSALLSAQNDVRFPQVKSFGTRAYEAASALLGEVEKVSRDGEANGVRLLEELNAFPLPLTGFDLPVVLPRRALSDESIQVDFSERSLFTIRWFEVLVEAVDSGWNGAAWWLAKPIIANGLSDLAAAWVSSRNQSREGESSLVLDWLATKALPVTPPVTSGAPLLERVLDYDSVLHHLTKLNDRLWKSEGPLEGEDKELLLKVSSSLGYSEELSDGEREEFRLRTAELAESVLYRIAKEFVYRGENLVALSEGTLFRYFCSFERQLIWANPTDSDGLGDPENSQSRSNLRHLVRRNVKATVRILRKKLGVSFQGDIGDANDFVKLVASHIEEQPAKDEPISEALTGIRQTTTNPTEVSSIVRKFLPASFAWMSKGEELHSFKFFEVGNSAEVIEFSKKEGDNEQSSKKMEEQAGSIGVVEMGAANYNTWEIVLNDEPYSDGVTSLLALADRFIARNDRHLADDLMQEALVQLSLLEKERANYISPEDRWQIGPLLRRVKLRLAWLAQGRDAYGRFSTQAPPRRLDALLGQLQKHLEQYERFLDDAREKMLVTDRLRRGALAVDLQRNEAEHAARSAERAMEKSRRLMANAQLRISSHQMRLGELDAEMQRGETQYEDGKKKAEQAASDLGALAMSAASAYLPVPAPLQILKVEAEDLIKVIGTVNDISNGQPPFQAIAASYGQDLIDMSFASFDAGELLGGTLNDGVKSAMDQFVNEGKVDLQGVSKRAMQRVGEDLFKAGCQRLGEYLENEIPETEYYKSAKKQWDEVKTKVTEVLDENVGIEHLRQIVNRTGIDLDKRVETLGIILEGAESELTTLRDGIRVGELSPDEVIRSFRRLSEDAEETWKEGQKLAKSALKNLGAVVCDSNNWWSLMGLADMKETVDEIVENVRNSKSRLSAVSRALGTSATTLASIFESIDRAVESERVQDQEKKLAINSQAMVSLAEKLVGELSLPFERILIELDGTSENASEFVGEISQSVKNAVDKVKKAREETDDVFDEIVQTKIAYRDAYIKALKDLGKKLKTVASISDGKVLFKKVVEVVAPLLRKADVELSAFSSQLAPEILGDCIVTAKEAVSGVLKGVEDRGAKDEFYQIVGEGVQSLDRMIMSAISTTDPSLSKALSSIGLTVPNILGGTAKDTSEILRYFEQDPEFKVPLPNGVLELVLNSGLARDNSDNPIYLLKKSEKLVGFKRNDLKDFDGVVREDAARLLLTKIPQIDDAKKINDTAKDSLKELSKKHPDGMPENKNSIAGNSNPPGEDSLSQLLGNSGTQAIVAAISASIPAVGIAIQAVGIVNNWLSGTTEQNAGAKKVRGSMKEARQVDQAVTDARHQQELAELELLAAQDDLSAAHQQRGVIRKIADFDAGVEDRDVYLQRMMFRKISSSIELITYDLYVIQKGFEYEFDVSLDEIFSRWPQLQRFRALLELSPGTLTGEFDRTNVHQDLIEHSARLSVLPELVSLVRDLVSGAKYRNTLSLSMKDDFPDEWTRFKKAKIPKPLMFETNLRFFIGATSEGHPMRHSVKIKSLKLKPRFPMSAVQMAESEARIGRKLDSSSGGSQPTFDVSPEGEEEPPVESQNVGNSNQPEPGYELSDPKYVGIGQMKIQKRRARQAARLIEEFPDRFKWVAFHAGEGWQIDEKGSLRWIEWGPQVADSNFETEKVDEYYNSLEGLTPATRWIVDFDRSDGLSAGSLDNIEIVIEYTYGKIEENVRNAFAAASNEQFSTASHFSSSEELVRDEIESPRKDALGAEIMMKHRIQTAHDQR